MYLKYYTTFRDEKEQWEGLVLRRSEKKMKILLQGVLYHSSTKVVQKRIG